MIFEEEEEVHIINFLKFQVRTRGGVVAPDGTGLLFIRGEDGRVIYDSNKWPVCR